jgi:hypothetical protein
MKWGTHDVSIEAFFPGLDSETFGSAQGRLWAPARKIWTQ